MKDSSKYLIKELKDERYFKEQYKLNTIDMNDYFAYSGKGECNKKLFSLMPDYRMKKINNDMSKYVLKDYNKKKQSK